MSQKKSVPATPEATTDAIAESGESRSQGVLVVLMVIGMFLLGLVVLVVGGGLAYGNGVPMFVIGIVAIALLAVVFTLLRRWADKVDAQVNSQANAQFNSQANAQFNSQA